MREKLIELKQFLEKEGFAMRPLNVESFKNSYGMIHSAPSEQGNSTRFYIAFGKKNGCTFHWESRFHDRKWFDERNKSISKHFTSWVEEKKVCRLWVSVAQTNYKESILEIIDKTRGTMGY